MSPRWHIQRDEGRLTLARHLPARFDFAAHTTLRTGDPLKLAHQIRQDLWRALQRLRGFSPVVELVRLDAGWAVTAGGRLAGPISPKDQARAQHVLDHTGNRARWQRFATQGQGAV